MLGKLQLDMENVTHSQQGCAWTFSGITEVGFVIPGRGGVAVGKMTTYSVSERLQTALNRMVGFLTIYFVKW